MIAYFIEKKETIYFLVLATRDDWGLIQNSVRNYMNHLYCSGYPAKFSVDGKTFHGKGYWLDKNTFWDIIMQRNPVEADSYTRLRNYDCL